MRLIIDMDDVLADTSEYLRKVFYQKTGKLFKDDQLIGIRIESLLTQEEKDILDAIYKRKEFFENVPVMKGAVSVVERLWSIYDVYIVSSAIQYPFSLEAKVNWMVKHFPFFNLDRLVLCGDKRIVKGDIMIDDNDFNLLPFQGRKILFNSLHNSQDTRFERVRSWKEIEALLCIEETAKFI